MEAELDFNKQQCRGLQLQLASAQKEEQDLRLPLSSQVKQLRLELQQCNVKLSTTRDEERVLWKQLMQHVNKEVAMNPLQTTCETICARNVKFEKDLAASKAERESLQKLHNIAMRAVALISNSKPARPKRPI
ncbi:unnamed protein product [Calypogeia fissa]